MSRVRIQVPKDPVIEQLFKTVRGVGFYCRSPQCRKFVASMHDHYKLTGRLSQKQIDAIEYIIDGANRTASCDGHWGDYLEVHDWGR